MLYDIIKGRKTNIAFTGAKGTRRLYYPTCLVCQYMRQHKAFSEAVMLCTYFDKNGAESLADVVKRFNDPFPMTNIYQHTTRHMRGKELRWRKALKLEEKSVAMKKKERAKEILNETLNAVEAPVYSQGEHIDALDEFIAAGRRKIEAGQMPITAQTYVQALKAKAEIENKTKDRRYDALKSLFAGAAPKGEDGQTLPNLPQNP